MTDEPHAEIGMRGLRRRLGAGKRYVDRSRKQGRAAGAEKGSPVHMIVATVSIQSIIARLPPKWHPPDITSILR